MAQEEALALAVRKVSKRFPGVQALDDVDSDLRQGKVHILLGENGAGKSTLIKIIADRHQGCSEVQRGRPPSLGARDVAEQVTIPAGDDSSPAGNRSTRSVVQYTSLGDQVYHVLWRQIVDRTLRPGDKISDVQISEELGVSRTPVREALYRLAQDKIVEAKSQRGFFVASFSSQDVREIYDIRAALEVRAMRLALPHLTAAQLEEAQQALDEARRQVEHDAEGARTFWLRVDRAFHQMIARTANNGRLQTLITGLQGQIGVLQVYGTYLLEIEQMALGHHQAILDAMRRADGAAAERAMEQHIQEVKARMLAEFDQREQRAAASAGLRRERKPRP